ncbi:hypothetical protein O3P69_001065 [Scylla paramamosain]|uniref:Transposase n=1 Tax=Scylla paramamosain TaxID=85552 RepID=A0AAW0UNF0_SCYPA
MNCQQKAEESNTHHLGAQSQACFLFNKTDSHLEDVNQFYENIIAIMDKYGLKLEDIYNIDETGCTTVQEPENVMTEKAQKQGPFYRFRLYTAITTDHVMYVEANQGSTAELNEDPSPSIKDEQNSTSHHVWVFPPSGPSTLGTTSQDKLMASSSSGATSQNTPMAAEKIDHTSFCHEGFTLTLTTSAASTMPTSQHYLAP